MVLSSIVVCKAVSNKQSFGPGFAVVSIIPPWDIIWLNIIFFLLKYMFWYLYGQYGKPWPVSPETEINYEQGKNIISVGN